MPTSETILTTAPELQLCQQESEHVVFPETNQHYLAWLDVKEGLLSWRVWLMLAYQDIKLRYRRSFLGPFWITISMGITVFSMGFLYGNIFHTGFSEYFPFLVGGMLAWSLISITIPELADTFTLHEMMMKQIKLPYTLYIHRVTTRNFIIFFHNVLVLVPIMILCHNQMKIGWQITLLIPALCILYFNCISLGIIFAMLGARYRDITQIIKSLVQIVFFVTPIMWKPDLLPANKQFIVQYNPVYAFIEIIRAPLVGYYPTSSNIMVVLFTSLIGFIVSYYFFVSRRARIIYWL